VRPIEAGRAVVASGRRRIGRANLAPWRVGTLGPASALSLMLPRRAVTVMRSQTALVLILLALVALAGVLWLPGLGDLASVP
jgi:hypothetical protein